MKHTPRLIIASLLWFGLFLPSTSIFAAPPSGFQNIPLLTDGLDNPTALAFAPDGRLFITEQTGKIKIFKDGELLSEAFGELPALALNDRGLLGIATDPEFESNHYVYFYYIDKNDSFHKIVRFNAENDTGKDGPVPIYSSKRVAAELHAGGGLDFGSDGKLYVSIGDSGPSTNAQDLAIPMGKVLRMNKDGSIPPDNPFVGMTDHDPYIWAYGFRNPFRMQFDGETGKLYLGDVGYMKSEEINYVEKGGNYGWPLAEGGCADCGFKNPIYTYANGGGASVVEGPVYRGEVFPEAYKGRLFFGDYVKQFIKTLDFNPDGTVNEVSDFEPDASSVIDIKAGPDGALYYLTIFPGTLHRIVYNAGNQEPTAKTSADEVTGTEPLTVQFSSAGSSDPEGNTLSYFWDFGDGTTSTEAHPTKLYPKRGHYAVKLSVSDGTHTASSSPLIIQVGTPPNISDIEPDNNSPYSAGETVHYSAKATDYTGDTLPDSAFTVEVLFHHNTHIHPFIQPKSGNSGSFVIPTTGETDIDVWYEIIITAKDGDGLMAKKSVRLDPRLSSLTFQTEPAGLKLSLNGQPKITPMTTGAVVGFRHEAEAADQLFGNTFYEFDHWSDSGASKHFITTPSSPATYTAFFRAGIPFRGEYFNNLTLSGTPVLTRDDTFIDFTWNNTAPDPSVNADNYSVRWTKKQQFASGRYHFTTSTDDGVRLFIDGVPVIDQWRDQGVTSYTESVDLEAGEHEIKMEYYEGAGGAIAKLSWDLDPNQPSPPPADSYAASYFANQNLSGTPALNRAEPALSFTWGNGSPDPLIPNDHFSARFTKTITLEDSPYQFTVKADDGIRVFVDDELILDQWIDQPATAYTVIRPFSAGDHILKVEYYENGGGAVLDLDYKKTNAAFIAEYFDNQNLAGTPKKTASLNSVNFDWKAGSPDAAIPNDHFSARFTKTENFAAGFYAFTVTADDGVRLYLDDALILDQWVDQPATTYTVEKQLTAGTHTLKLEYYENGGGAVVKLVSAAAAPWNANYWNTPGTSSSPVLPETAPTLTRTESLLDFNWGAGSPHASIANDHFVARFNREIKTDQGNYELSVTADDGVRIFVDGVKMIDQWNDQGPTTFLKNLPLSAGAHTIVVEYYENGGGATLKFSLQKRIPQEGNFTAQYFGNQDLSGAPLATDSPSQISFNWGSGSPLPAIPNDHFSARFTKTENFAAGDYQFTLDADDGVRFFIDNVPVVDDWTDHAMKHYESTLHLENGPHTLRIEYYENGGQAVVRFSE